MYYSMSCRYIIVWYNTYIAYTWYKEFVTLVVLSSVETSMAVDDTTTP